MSDDKQVDDLCRRFRELEDNGQKVDVDVFCADEGIEDPRVVAQMSNRLQTQIMSDESDDDVTESAGKEDDSNSEQRPVSESRRSSDPSDDESAQPMGLVKSRASASPKRRKRGTITDPSLLEGLTSVADYDSFEPLAAGGLGEVFTAKHTLTDDHTELEKDRTRRVAVKLIRRDKMDEKRRKMFVSESVITAKLEHPGVVPVYGFGNTKDRPFYVMRLIQGENMRDRIQSFHANLSEGGLDAGENSVNFHELLNHFISVCNTLAYAHDCGIIHRDVKPENIMLGHFGETLVVDWGLARTYVRTTEEKEESGLPTLIQETKDRNFAEGIEGTPNYLSPEQADPLSYVGRPTDIYGLGACLYEILTGKLAVDGNDLAEVLNIVRANTIRPAREVNKLVPKPLEAICQKAMARRAEDRYHSALDLADDVRRYLANEPVSAYQESPIQQSMRWIRLHRKLSLLAGAFGLVAIVVIACVLAMGRVHDQNILDINLKSLETQAEKQAHLLISDIDRLKEDVRYLARRPDVDELARTPKEALKDLNRDLEMAKDGEPELKEESKPLHQIRTDLENVFRQFIDRDESYMQARIIGKDGIERLRVERTNGTIKESRELADKSASSYFIEGKNQERNSVYLSEFNVNKENGIRDFDFPVVRACVPLTDSDDAFQGIVVINMHFRRLENFIRGDKNNRDTMVYLTNEKGQFLIHEEKDLGFSFERNLPYRARDVYRPLAQFISSGPQDTSSDSRQTNMNEPLQKTHVRPRCSIFIKPTTTNLSEKHYRTLKKGLDKVFEAYENVTAEPSEFRKEESSCHGIITGVDATDVSDIVEILEQTVPDDLGGEFGDHFKVVPLPRRAVHEQYTVYCQKIPLDPNHPDSFLALILAQPNPKPSFMSRVISLVSTDD